MFGADNGVYTISLRSVHSAREVDTIKDRGDSFEAPAQRSLPPMASCVRPRLVQAIDAAIAIFVIVVIALVEVGIVPTAQRGFWCNDPSISYRYKGETITPGALGIGTFVAPLIFMFLAEHWSASGSGCGRVKLSLKRMLRWYWQYVIGLFIALFVIEVMKAIVGEPRPHFMDSCRPEPGYNCTYGTYITSYTCTNKALSRWNTRETTRSFPSGHAGIACYTTIFMVWYLQNRARLYWGSKFAAPLIQAMYLCYAIICSVTRITDHRHHWWDVLIGAFIGVAVSVFIVKSSCHQFRSHRAERQVKDIHHAKFGALVGLDGGGAVSMQNGVSERDERARHQSARRLLSDMSHAEDTPVSGQQIV